MFEEFFAFKSFRQFIAVVPFNLFLFANITVIILPFSLIVKSFFKFFYFYIILPNYEICYGIIFLQFYYALLSRSFITITVISSLISSPQRVFAISIILSASSCAGISGSASSTKFFIQSSCPFFI